MEEKEEEIASAAAIARLCRDQAGSRSLSKPTGRPGDLHGHKLQIHALRQCLPVQCLYEGENPRTNDPLRHLQT